MNKKSDTITLSIDSVAYGGMGIGRHNGIVHFVNDALPGEVVSAQITERKKRFVLAQTITRETASPHRQQPPCPYYAQCGGCVYQHCSYPYQRILKKQQVVDIFERISKIEHPPVADVITTDNDFHFRNRITIHKKKCFGNTVGFFSHNNTSIIPIKSCLLAHPAINDALAMIQRTAEHVPFGDIIISSDDNHIGVLTTKTHSTTDSRLLATCAIDSVPRTFTDLTFSPVDLQNQSQRHRWQFNALRFQYAPYIFFQTNPSILHALCNYLQSHYSTSSKAFIDAYCGAGLFTILLADRYTSIVGIEENPQAITLASINAQHNELSHIRFMAQRTEQQLPLALKKHTASVDVMLDPPRSGLSDHVVKTLLKHTPQQITYLSCEPSTAARDMLRLSTAYTITAIVPFDMFPQTKHIELLITAHKK